MDLIALVSILNNGIPATVVGNVSAAMIVRLIDKVKTMFNGKAITKENAEQLMAENVELKETLASLQDELAKANIEIKNQFNHSTFYNTTFN
ncbi:hypothetical protein AGMMS50239_00450 [Bacteroidia bacterium]|nr:hypothetical protein AGMMS50239_00450 [Bacteroidia bacterium]GHU67347.1 hypothetical protein FACS189413_01970 [Bacteroidia bacterium]